MSKTINAGRVTFVPKDNFSNNISYKKFDIVTYNGSSYFAKKDTIGHTPTEEEFWQLVAEKGQNGAPGAVKMQVVDTLPETGETDTIYLVKKDNPGEQNLYDEYVYTDTGWEHIGDTSVDLTDYYTKTETIKLIDSSLKKYYLTMSLPMSMWNGNSYSLDNVTKKSIHDILKDVYDNNRKSFEIILINSSIDYNTPKTITLYCNEDVTQKPTIIRIYSDILGGTHGELNNQSNLTSKFFSVSFVIYLSWSGDDFTFNTGPITTFSSFEILRKDNLYPYTPTADYHPATKKYVDDSIANINIPMYTITTTDRINLTGKTYATPSEMTTLLNNILADAYTKGFHSFLLMWYSEYNDTTFVFKLNKNLQSKSNTYVLIDVCNLRDSVNANRLYIDLKWEGDIPTIKHMNYRLWDTNYLNISNEIEYTPTGDYNPATKKYVDDQVGNINTVLATLTTVSEVTK